MKHFLLSLSFVVLFFPSCMESKKNDNDGDRSMKENNNETVINGAVSLKDTSFQSLLVRGAASLNEVLVTNNCQVYGGFNAQDSEFNTLNVHGGCNLSDSKLSGKLQVNGGLHIKNCAMAKDVVVNGGMHATHVTIEGLTQVNGGAFMKDSELQKFEITATTVHFENSSIQSILMHKNEQSSWAFWNKDKQQVITLIDTVVYGDVVLEKVGGKVELKGSSDIKGEVVGGTVERIK